MTARQSRPFWRLLVPITLALTRDVFIAVQGGPAIFGSAIIETQSRSLLLIFAIVILSALTLP
ncbi:MAG: hypothetical protein AAGE03_12305 [Pseudomonadota bacterium]